MMEGVLEATLLLCVCKLTCSVLFCLPAAARAVTAVSLCSCCLLLFTDLVITLFLLYVWLVESWFLPFQLSSDEIALRFSIFLCQAYGVVLLLTPPLIAVELLVHLLRSQGKADGTKDTKTQPDKTLWFQFEPVSRTVGFLSCCLVWVVSGTYSRNNWMLGQLSAETCLEKNSCLISCLPGFLMSSSAGMEDLSWFLPVMVLLLSVTGAVGQLKSRVARRGTGAPESTSTHWGRWRNFVAPRLIQTQQPKLDKTSHLFVESSAADSIKKTNRAGFVYQQERWFCPGNVALCSYQTALAGSFISEQKPLTSVAPFLQSNTSFPLAVTSLEHNKMVSCDFKKTEPVVKETLQPQGTQRYSESLWRAAEPFSGLVCLLVVCVFPTIISGNVLLIFSLEKLLVYSVKLLSLAAHRVSIH